MAFLSKAQHAKLDKIADAFPDARVVAAGARGPVVRLGDGRAREIDSRGSLAVTALSQEHESA